MIDFINFIIDSRIHVPIIMVSAILIPFLIIIKVFSFAEKKTRIFTILANIILFLIMTIIYAFIIWFLIYDLYLFKGQVSLLVSKNLIFKIFNTGAPIYFKIGYLFLLVGIFIWSINIYYNFILFTLRKKRFESVFDFNWSNYWPKLIDKIFRVKKNDK